MSNLEGYVNYLNSEFFESALLLIVVAFVALIFYSPKGRSPVVGLRAYLSMSRNVKVFWTSAIGYTLAVSALIYLTYVVPAVIDRDVDQHWDAMGKEMCEAVPGCVDYLLEFHYSGEARGYLTKVNLTSRSPNPDTSAVQAIYEKQITELGWVERTMLADEVVITIAKSAPKKASRTK